jgi:uncharacterized protein involved in response to NO
MLRDFQWTLRTVRTEPYRVLFPLGILGAVIGIGLWIPQYLWPASFGYPGQSHAVLQIQGFLLCFIFGFLGTMLPKVHGVAPLGPVQFALFPAGLIALNGAALAGFPLLAQTVHLGLLVNFLVFAARRWPTRRGNPPAFFVFIAAGMLSDAVGTVFRIIGLSGYGPAQNFRLGALLQYQAFPLLLILGVGGYLLPKLFANEQIDPLRMRPAGGSLRMLLLAAGLFLTGYGIEAWLPGVPLSVRLGSGVRAAVWIWFLFSQLRVHRIPARLPAYLAGARWALLAMGVGMILPVFLPQYLLAWEHVVFITGLLWITLSVATRVLTAHGGALAAIDARRKTVLAYGWLLLLAALTRVSTEIWPGGRALHLALAATFAIIGLALWSALFGRLIFRLPGDRN